MPSIEPLIMLMRIAKEVSTELPVPGLSTALEIALNIAEKAKEIKDTRDGCRSLAERAAYFSWGVYDKLKNCDSDSQSIATKEHVKLLLCTLYDIEGLMKRRRKMRALNFLRRHADIAEDVQKISTQLEDAIKLFVMQTGVDLEQRMDVLMNTNVRLLQHVEDSAHVGDAILGEARDIRIGVWDLAQRLHSSATFDGSFRLFSRESLDLLEPIDEAALGQALARRADEHAPPRGVVKQRTGRVVRYRAIVKAAGDLDGTKVVVHTYPASDKSRFMEGVAFSQQTCNPYMLAVLGYSRLGSPGQTSYIVTEDYSPLVEYLRTFRGTNLLRAILKLIMQICMAVNHLETMELRGVLSSMNYPGVLGVQYEFTLGDLVFDHRHGGRIKWARDSLSMGETSNREVRAPAKLENRMGLLNDFCPVICASTDEVAHFWFSHLAAPFLLVAPIPGRMLMDHWQVAVDRPQYALGSWVGRTHLDGVGVVLSAGHSGIEVHRTFWDAWYCAPRQDSHPEALAELSQQRGDEDEDEYHFKKKLEIATWLDIPHSDRSERGIDFMLAMDGTGWKRYQFSCIPVGTTLIFQQHLNIQANHDTMMAPLPADISVSEYKHISFAIMYGHDTETTATMTTQAAQTASPSTPLWFFQLQCYQSAVDPNRIPCGFWSLEKHPTSIPGGITFDPTLQFERMQGNVAAPLSTWTQVLGDLTFTIQTKMYTMFLELSEDEVLALKELQENRYSTNDSHLSDEDSTDDGIDSPEPSDSNTSGPAQVRAEPSFEAKDATDSEDDGVEEYYSAEEEEDETPRSGEYCPY